MVPQIAIKFESCGEESDNVSAGVGAGVPRDRVKVVVSIESPEFEYKDNVRRIVTFLYVEDPTEFEHFLTFKYNKTKNVWKKKNIGASVDADEAHTLRTASRAEAARITPSMSLRKIALMGSFWIVVFSFGLSSLIVLTKLNC